MPTTPLFGDDDAAGAADWLSAHRYEDTILPDMFRTNAIRLNASTEHDWLNQRRSGIGASEVGVIVGASTWTSPYALWWRKKLDWRIPRTEAQQWGHLVEEPIAELFAAEMAETLYIAKPLGHPYSVWTHPDNRWMLCTPDRLAVTLTGEVVPVELKSDEGGGEWGEPGTDQVPRNHRCQALWQAHIFGASGTYVVRKASSAKRRMRWYWVPYDTDEVVRLRIAAADFLGSLEMGESPAPDGSTATTDALKEINPAIDPDTFASVPRELRVQWVAARTGKAEAVERERLASNRMRAAMGRAEYATYQTADGLDVIFAKRRMGKRQGYAVAPATTDELRMVGEQQTTDAGIRPHRPEDTGATPPPQEERPRGADLEGDGVVNAEGHAAQGGATPSPQGTTPDAGPDGLDLPPELHVLWRRAVDNQTPLIGGPDARET